MRKLIVSAVLALVLVVSATVPVFAATTADVDVTATPAFVSITNLPTTWAINGLTGDSLIRPSTTYYSNPLGDETVPSTTVLDTECYFTVTNDGTVNVNIAIDFPDFTLGDTMTNGGTGAGGVGTFGAKGYVSDVLYASAVTLLDDVTGTVISSLAPGTKKWGIMLATQTDAFTSSTAMTSTVLLRATEA